MALRQTGIEVQEFQTLSGIPENADTYRLFVVDGDIKPGNAIELSRDLRRQQSTVRIDALSMLIRSISAASTDATAHATASRSMISRICSRKTHRDEFIRQAALQYPHYGWESNKAYPTAAHSRKA